ncbi:MAG: CapA family protein, partial [Deltaproteobacteria bacterium]|nr:CapA family protein [Deltaproteobacteria bacterium]
MTNAIPPMRSVIPILASLVFALSSSSAQTDSTIVLRFAGDCLLAGHYETEAGQNGGFAFEEFDLFKTDDVSLVNLECPITTRGTRREKPYTFRMRPSYTRALKEAGIDIVNLANNHVFDYGSEGIFDTFSYLDSIGIRHIGAGRTLLEARRPVVVSLKGRRIGFLGYYSGGEAPNATDSTAGVRKRTLASIEQDIRLVRERDSADYVVVSFHWGDEKAESPDSGQIWFARQTVRAGADAVIGHHTHVLSGIERYRNGVIVYSLGNFVFGGNARHTYDTAIFEIALTASGPRYS